MVTWLLAWRQTSLRLLLVLLVLVRIVSLNLPTEEMLSGWWIEEQRRCGFGHLQEVVARRAVVPPAWWGELASSLSERILGFERNPTRVCFLAVILALCPIFIIKARDLGVSIFHSDRLLEGAIGCRPGCGLEWPRCCCAICCTVRDHTGPGWQ